MAMSEDCSKALSARLRSEAIGLGLCDEWTDAWSDDSDKDALVRKFVRGIDFCIYHDWPSCDVMKRDFGDVIHRHGVYVDEKVDAVEAPFLVLNGACECTASYDWHTSGEIYVRHSSRLRLSVKCFSRVFLNVYDAGHVEVSCDEGSKCFVYMYGGVVDAMSGDVVIRDRRNK